MHNVVPWYIKLNISPLFRGVLYTGNHSAVIEALRETLQYRASSNFVYISKSNFPEPEIDFSSLTNICTYIQQELAQSQTNRSRKEELTTEYRYVKLKGFFNFIL